MELDTFKNIFKLNDYPIHFFDKCICLFLDKVFVSFHCFTMSPKKFPISDFLSLALILFKSAHKVLVFVRPLFPMSTFVSSFVQPSAFFSFKDRIPKGVRSHVVYSFTCQCCTALYVGQTTRHLHTWISDHLGISAITGKKRPNPSLSSVLSNRTATGHSAALDDFKILSSCNSTPELLIRESLLISKLKPSLNGNLSSVPLSLF